MELGFLKVLPNNSSLTVGLRIATLRSSEMNNSGQGRLVASLLTLELRQNLTRSAPALAKSELEASG